MTLSGANQRIDIVFGTPIGPGETFDIHIPIRYLSDSGFVLTQTATIPEPASVVIWSLLGGLAVAVGWWRRRR